jgi:hypothetical protein
MPLSREDHLFGPGPKRILSLDGGGVRGLITLGMLAKVESILKGRSSDPANFRLCDYFDLVGGTSTGALIATLVALGYQVDDIISLYRTMAPAVFRKKRVFQGIQSKFDSSAFRKAIDATLSDFLRRSGRDPRDLDVLRMNSDMLRTGLALVTKRIDTASAWVLTNNRKAKYWDASSALWKDHFAAQGSSDFYPNSDYPLATIVRASASAPFYLDGVDLRISKTEHGHFLDGGASPFNNPCQELFLMTTLTDHKSAWTKEGVSPFGFNWQTGEKELFMLSLGSGTWRNRIASKQFAAKTAAMKAVHALAGIIDDADKAATTWMQAISEGPAPHRIDGNLLEMQHLRILPKPLLTFRRVNPLLESSWLEGKLGLDFKYSEEVLANTRELDRPDQVNLARLHRIGVATGETLISDVDFPPSFDVA